jgi:hypothetical protein
MIFARSLSRTEGCFSLYIPRSDFLTGRSSSSHLPYIDSSRRIRVPRGGPSPADGDSAPSGAVLPPVESLTFESRFQAKAADCLARCDFGPSHRDEAAISRKTDALTAIMRATETPGDAVRFPPAIVRSLLDLVCANVERPLRLIDSCLVITEDFQPFPDPEWEHLGIVYQILIKFYDCVPQCPMVDLPFIRRVLKQIGSRDEREQLAIRHVVSRFAIHERREALPALFTALAMELSVWESSPNFMFAASVLLGIATDFVTDFPGSPRIARPLVSHCLSLLSAPSFFFFRTPFLKFLIALLEADSGYGFPILKAAFHFWPQLSAAKQSCFLRLFSLAIPKLTAKQLSLVAPRLLALLSASIESPFARAAESALGLLVERSFKVFLMTKVRSILPAVYDSIRNVAAHHWNNEVRAAAARMLDTFAGLDASVCRDLARGNRPAPDATAQKMVAWMQIADAASANGFASGSKFPEISRLFGNVMLQRPQARTPPIARIGGLGGTHVSAKRPISSRRAKTDVM